MLTRVQIRFLYGGEERAYALAYRKFLYDAKFRRPSVPVNISEARAEEIRKTVRDIGASDR